MDDGENMDDGGFTANSSMSFDNIDIDFMDQLLDDGCWLQTADGSNLLQSPPCITDAMSFNSDSLPAAETNSTNLALVPQEDACQRETLGLDLASIKTSHVNSEADHDLDHQSPNQKGIQLFNSQVISPQVNLLWEGSEQNRIWIAPKADAGPSSSVKDRLMVAIRHFQSLTRDRGLLIQIWVPVRSGIKNFLTTDKQPYFYDPDCAPVVNYRNVSESYQLSADEDSKESLGLPGRVFLGKVPEWTPDVRFFRQDEYPRVNYAQLCDVRGSVAVPVFERESGNCLGVVEIVTTSQKINYWSEVESVCKALEAVDLRSSEITSPLKKKGESGQYNIELSEILRIIRTVCDEYSLPLGQTWAPCTQHTNPGCWHLDKNTRCFSTVDSACYVRDQQVSGFHEACCEQHLFLDQGIVGKAFMTSQPCYAIDITAYSKGEYPLSHHAKMFGLRGAITMHLECLYGACKSYVLEFFLPINCLDPSLTFHRKVMELLTMEVQGCHSFTFLSPKEIEQEPEFAGKELSFSVGNLGGENDVGVEPLSSSKPIQEDRSSISNLVEAQRKGKDVALALAIEEFKESTCRKNEFESQRGQVIPDCEDTKKEFGSTGILRSLDGSSGGDCSLKTRKMGERRTHKIISLQVLRQYFAGSLKDAAKSIGVCPTTLKRICRQHGITRWPSRKIKKVDHSLRKLQLVIDSVPGAQGSVKLSSFYSNFPKPDSPTALKINDQAEQHPSALPENANSSSQTSSSSHSHATGAKSPPAADNATDNKDPSTVQDPVGLLKKSRSEVGLDVLNKKTSAVLTRSHSNKSVGKHPLTENLHSLPRNSRNWDLKDGVVYKVKATYGEDKIRLPLAPNMGFGDLQREIATRFNIDVNRMHIKYLDDDEEWVLLTCDDDLEECMDIQKSSGNHTVKISVHQAAPTLGSSFGTSGQS